MRLSISLVAKEHSTPQEAVEAVTAAILRGCRNVGQVPTEPWREGEHRGVITVANVAAGTYRLVTNEVKPEAAADALLDRHGITLTDAVMRKEIRGIIAQAIYEDRQRAAGILPDDDF
jgi:hypothetical protein